jgi:quercetin dioxygenase-like cupin family protein
VNESNNLSDSVIFPKGEKITNDYFIGAVWLEMLISNDSTFNCPIGNVTFEPGARNNWHKHPGGQLLLVIQVVKDIIRKKVSRYRRFMKGM